jgi:hypothetical protein
LIFDYVYLLFVCERFAFLLAADIALFIYLWFMAKREQIKWFCQLDEPAYRRLVAHFVCCRSQQAVWKY